MANKDYDYILVRPIEFTKYLNKLKENAEVIVIEENQLTYYTVNNYIVGFSELDYETLITYYYVNAMFEDLLKEVQNG